MGESVRAEQSRIICSHLVEVVSPADTVLVYCSKQPEVETCSFIDHLISRQIPVVVPIIQKEDTSLRLSYLTSRDALTPGTFSVPEPTGNESPASPAKVTSAIIPMLGFDRNGGRLGYGAGYYDRFLSKYPHIRTIGVAFSCQEIDLLPVQDHDIRMDIVVTEREILHMREGGA